MTNQHKFGHIFRLWVVIFSDFSYWRSVDTASSQKHADIHFCRSYTVLWWHILTGCINWLSHFMRLDFSLFTFTFDWVVYVFSTPQCFIFYILITIYHYSCSWDSVFLLRRTPDDILFGCNSANTDDGHIAIGILLRFAYLASLAQM